MNANAPFNTMTATMASASTDRPADRGQQRGQPQQQRQRMRDLPGQLRRPATDAVPGQLVAPGRQQPPTGLPAAQTRRPGLQVPEQPGQRRMQFGPGGRTGRRLIARRCQARPRLAGGSPRRCARSAPVTSISGGGHARQLRRSLRPRRRDESGGARRAVPSRGCRHRPRRQDWPATPRPNRAATSAAGSLASRTTVTGQVACAVTYWLTEPNSSPTARECPRAPTTS